MQFLRQQRNGRKRKTYLEKIGLSDKIKYAKNFYENYKVIQHLKNGGQGQICYIQPKSNDHHHIQDDEKKNVEMEGNETNLDDFDHELVVKIISFSDLDNESIKIELESAMNQFQLLKKLNLVNQKDIYYDENKKELLIVTEKLTSNLSELKHLIDIRNEDDLRQIMCDILDKLNILHSNGYIHCDITPDNIMKDKYDNFVLIDYDMMMKIDLKRGYNKDLWKGTINWTSPEIGQDIDSSNNIYSFGTDLWSFGLILLYIINDFKNPFEITKDEIYKNELNDEQTKLEYFYKYKMTLDEYNKIQILLATLFSSDKISLNLYDLLLNHLLVFDTNDRCKSCKDLMNHPWFKIKYRAKCNSKEGKREQ